MRKIRRYILVFLMSFVICLGFTTQVHAYDRIETDRPSSLTIYYKYDDTPLSGATFNIYYLATVDEFVNFTLTPDFASYPIAIEGNDIDDWNRLAETLRGYTVADALTPMYTVVTGSDGKVTVDNMAAGLYLVIGEKLVIGDFTYFALPAIVCLPSADVDGVHWNYDVTMSPKVLKEFNYPDGKETTREVRKIWKDEKYENKRPNEVIIDLYCDAVLYDTVVLNEDNDWYYCWEHLPVYDEDYVKIQWTFVERTRAENYTVKTEENGLTFIVINTYKPPGPPEPPDIPDTGVLWWPVPVLLCMGIVTLTAGVIYRRRYN